MVINNDLVSHIYVAIVFRFFNFISCVYICWQYIHIYNTEVLKVIKNLFKELEVFII